MQRIALGALCLIAVAAVLWLALQSGENEEAGPAAAPTDVQGGAETSARGAATSPGARVEGAPDTARSSAAQTSDGAARAAARAPAGDPSLRAEAARTAPAGEAQRDAVSPTEPGAAGPDLAAAPLRGAEPAAADAGSEPGAPRADDADAGGTDTLTALETEAARIAESLGLVEPAELERRLERAVPEGSLPPDQLEQAREDVRRTVLADAAIIEDLVRARYGPDTPEPALREARDLGRTLLSAQGEEYRARRLEGLRERLGE